jgi:hypothetical protein
MSLDHFVNVKIECAECGQVQDWCVKVDPVVPPRFGVGLPAGRVHRSNGSPVSDANAQSSSRFPILRRQLVRRSGASGTLTSGVGALRFVARPSVGT